MAAAVAVAADLDRPGFGHAGLLAEAWQGVILAEEGDHRTAFASLADDGGGDASHAALYAEALLPQLRHMLRRRALLGVTGLRHPPDAIGEGDEAFLGGVHLAPEVVAIVHVGDSIGWTGSVGGPHFVEQARFP